MSMDSMLLPQNLLHLVRIYWQSFIISREKVYRQLGTFVVNRGYHYNEEVERNLWASRTAVKNGWRKSFHRHEEMTISHAPKLSPSSNIRHCGARSRHVDSLWITLASACSHLTIRGANSWKPVDVQRERYREVESEKEGRGENVIQGEGESLHEGETR